jgi:anti-sigma factor RsiW
MTCTQIQPELVAYHFGVVSDDARRRVEAHLPECSDCLRSFLALKREIETGHDGPHPSEAARLRLRHAVAQELKAREPRRPWSWWERPFAFGFAGSAVVAAMIATRVLTSGPGSPPHSLQAPIAPAAPSVLER